MLDLAPILTTLAPVAGAGGLYVLLIVAFAILGLSPGGLGDRAREVLKIVVRHRGP